jgi:hypothetical protein
MRVGSFALAFLLVAASLPAAEVRVTSVPAETRAAFRLSPFYTKFVDVGGIPIVASDKVSDFALLEARHLILQMLGHRPDVLTAIARNRVRLAVMATSELTTDIPEHSDLTPKDYWDRRARGLGATEARPAVSCGEENLLGYPGDPYSTENILIHEFGHVIHQRGLSAVDSTFERRLNAAYTAAKSAGLWRNTYAGSNVGEYWAEGVQSWFDTNRENDSEHNHVNTRAELKTYDAGLAALLAEAFGDREWRYAFPARRAPASLHLAGFDAAKAPRFVWPDHLQKRTEAATPPIVANIPAASGSLAILAPNSRPSWKSGGSSQATKIEFRNDTTAAVEVDWMDFEGRPKKYFSVPPGGQAEAITYSGHIWRIRGQGGAPLGYVVAPDQPSTAVIQQARR